MKLTEKIAAAAISEMTANEELGWPPVCWGGFYQPERPISNYASEDHPQKEISDTKA